MFKPGHLTLVTPHSSDNCGTVHLKLTHRVLHTLGQNVALMLHDVLGAKVPLSGATEKGSNTCHWKFVTSSLRNKEYNNYNSYCSMYINSSSIFKQLLNYETICQTIWVG